MLKSCTFFFVVVVVENFHKRALVQNEALKQRQGSLSVEFVVLSHTHTSVCVLGFSGALTNNWLSVNSGCPGCIWGLSAVITDHLIIITAIKNKSVQACDIQIYHQLSGSY